MIMTNITNNKDKYHLSPVINRPKLDAGTVDSQVLINFQPNQVYKPLYRHPGFHLRSRIVASRCAVRPEEPGVFY
jgi:hypothetical protein